MIQAITIIFLIINIIVVVIPYMAKHLRGKLSRFSQIFTPAAEVFPCMLCMLVALIHYSDGMMALTAST